MSDLISRQAAIDTEGLEEEIRCEICRNPMHTSRGCDGNCTYDEKLYEKIMQILDRRIKQLPSAEPERKTGKWIPVHPQILDDAERRYLSAVIRPFRNKIKQIAKYGGHHHNYFYEYIAVMYYVDQASITYSFGLPVYPEGTMYKGMEVNRYYTLEELGL